MNTHGHESDADSNASFRPGPLTWLVSLAGTREKRYPARPYSCSFVSIRG